MVKRNQLTKFTNLSAFNTFFSDTVAINNNYRKHDRIIDHRIRKQNSATVLKPVNSCGLFNFSLVSQVRYNHFYLLFTLIFTAICTLFS